MKRKLMAAFLSISMIAALSACGGGGASEKASEAPASGSAEAVESAAEEAPAPSGDGITLTFLASQDWVYDAEKELGAKFEEETGIHIDYQIIPGDQYYTVLMTKLNSGEGPDIFGGQSGRFDIVTQFDIEKNGVDLSDQPWVEYYDEFAKVETAVDDKVYGQIYFDTTTDFYMVYNKKLFEEAGITEVPTTFAAYMEDCQKLMDNGVIPFYECSGDGWHHVMWFCEIGGRFEEMMPGLTDKLNNNETTFAETEIFKTCLEQMKEMADKGYWGDNYQSDEYAGMAAALGTGEYAMTMAKPGTIQEIADASGGTYSADDFGLFYIPTLDNQVLNVHPVGPTRFIYSGSQYQEEAKQYLNFMAQPENLQYMIDNEPKVENYPFSAGQTPAYSESTRAFIEGSEKSGTVWQDAIKYLNPQWWDFGQDMIAYFNGDMDVDQVLANVDQRRVDQATAAGDPNWN